MQDQSGMNMIILGAAGRDFHDFNVYWKHRTDRRVVAFTATQIPDIDGRKYPPQLAGPRYADGIPIVSEDTLESVIAEHGVQLAAMAYSDLSYAYVMGLAARVNAAGAAFTMLAPKDTMIAATKPVVAICAVRTGCGKSQTTRRISAILKQRGKKVAVMRHPMPYGDLTRQICQRYESLDDLDRYQCTIEEREEYEPHIQAGNLLLAGIDYERILDEAQKSADVILWDGGNNDTPFVQPDLLICVTDPHRAGHECGYYPGEINLRLADAVVVNKVDTADPGAVERVLASVQRINPRATVIQAASPVTVDHPEMIRGKRVLVIEDGPTVTHGGMAYGAGHVAARQFGAGQIVDPRPHATGSIRGVFEKYTHLTDVLPAMGYGKRQIRELEATVERVDCDLVIVGTPIDLRRVIHISQPSVRVLYELDERDKNVLPELVKRAVG